MSGSTDPVNNQVQPPTETTRLLLGAPLLEKPEPTKFQVFLSRHSNINLSWELGKVAAPVIIAMLASTLADSIIQHFTDKLPKEDGAADDLAAACQWIGTFKLLQSALAAPTGALYSLLSNKLGEAAQAVRNNNSLLKEKAVSGLFQLAQQGIFYAIWSSVLVSSLFYFSGFILENIFHENHQVSSIAQKFLRWYLLGIPAFSYAAAVRPYLCVLNQRKWVSVVNFLSVPLVFVLSLISSKNYFSNFSGLEGLAITMAARSWFMAIICTVIILKNKVQIKEKLEKIDSASKELEEIDLGIFKLSKIFSNWCHAGFFSSMKEFMTTGIPLTGRLGVEWASSFFNSVFYGDISKEALAVDSVMSSVLNFILMPSMAFASAGSQKVGVAEGAGDRNLAYRYGNASILFSLTWAALWVAMIYPLAKPFAQVFLSSAAFNNPLVTQWLPGLMLLGAASQLFDALRVSSSGAYQGKTKDTLKAMGWSFLGMGVIGIPLSYGLGLHTSLQPYGIALGTIAGDLVAGALCTWLWLDSFRVKVVQTGAAARPVAESNGSEGGYSMPGAAGLLQQQLLERHRVNSENSDDSEQKSARPANLLPAPPALPFLTGSTGSTGSAPTFPSPSPAPNGQAGSPTHAHSGPTGSPTAPLGLDLEQAHG